MRFKGISKDQLICMWHRKKSFRILIFCSYFILFFTSNQMWWSNEHVLPSITIEANRDLTDPYVLPYILSMDLIEEKSMYTHNRKHNKTKQWTHFCLFCFLLFLFCKVKSNASSSEWFRYNESTEISNRITIGQLVDRYHDSCRFSWDESVRSSHIFLSFLNDVRE